MKQLCLGAVITLFFFLGAAGKENLVVEKGKLDLTFYDWNDGPIKLAGEWEFYWNKFYRPSFFNDLTDTFSKHFAKVPSFWNKDIPGQNSSEPAIGFATYRIVVKCPSTDQQMALKFLTIESAYRVYINGKEVLNIGNADTTAIKTAAILKPYILEVTPENDSLDIVIQVSNFHNRSGGIWDSIYLGSEKQLQGNLVKQIALQCFAAGFFLLAFIYYLILFFSFKNRYTLLFFGLLCLIICIRILVTDEMPLLYVAHTNWEIARRLEYISLFLSVPVACLFSYYLFPLDFNKKVLYVLLPVCGLFLLLSLFGSYYYYTYVIQYYEFLILAVALYGLFVYMKAVVNKRQGSLLFLVAFCIFIFTVVNDVLYASLIIKTIPLSYFGLSVFVIILSVILSRQFSQNFAELQLANVKMLETNTELAARNREISGKNKELSKINTEMDSLVNRASHDLRSPLASVLGINKLVKDVQNEKDLKEYLLLQEKTLIRMDSLIKDIIDFSTNKREELELKETDFSLMVNDVLEDHAYMYNALTIKKNIDIQQYEKFISDPRRINIILSNLVSNAIKYADPEKENQELNINILVGDNMATIEVTDNGIGIEEQHLNKIFTLFYRVSNNNPSSGLGLYIIKETVEKLNGYVIIHSKKGDGTSVKTILPNIGYKL